MDGHPDYRVFDVMTTQELEQILWADSHCSPEDALDEDAILYVLELLEQRQGTSSDGGVEVHQKLKELHDIYLSDSDPASLYDFSFESQRKEKSVAITQKRRNKGLRRVGVVAATISILFATMVAAQAAGLDVWGAIARWTDETFRFTFQGDKATSSWMDGQEELNDSAFGAILPSWMPEGYTVEEIQLYEFQKWQRVYLSLSGQDLPTFRLFIRFYESPQPIQDLILEKDGTPVQERQLSNGETVYFYENEGYSGSVYQHQNIVYSISGDVMPEVVMEIFESVPGVI